MTVAAKYFNDVELGTYGLVTPSVSGIFDLAQEELARTFIPGNPMPNDVDVRTSLVQVRWKCVVSGTDHDELVSKLANLRTLLSPRLGWCPLAVENRADQRTWARCQGLPIAIDTLPYQMRVVEFDLIFDRVGYWEDDTVTEVADPESITYDGGLVTYPIYACTALQALSSMSLQVGTQIFTYQGNMAQNDVLTITTELPDVVLNNLRAFADTHQDSIFPVLNIGVNEITKTGNYSLVVSYRRRYE